MSSVISNTDFQSDIKSFKQSAQKSQLKGSISGIAVNGTGLSFNPVELAERSANLLSVRKLEEQERNRRIAEDSKYQQKEFNERLGFRKAAAALEEAEQRRRIANEDGSEQLRERLAKDLAASIASSILPRSVKLQNAALDMWHNAGDLVYRAASFFGHKVSDRVHAIRENLHDIKETTIERAQELGSQASSKAVEVASRKAHEIVNKAQDLGEQAVHFGTQKYSDALRIIEIGKLDFAEETERQYRTTIGLSVERFLLAMKTSALVRDYWSAKGQYDDVVFNSWYGTGILEEFERKRRVIHDKTNGDWQANAKKAAQAIHLHNIETQSYRPQMKQLDHVSAVIFKKAEEIRAAPTRAAAAM